MQPSERQVERFWQRVQQTETCWLWIGGLKEGFGSLYLTKTRAVFVHRFAFELLVGPIPGRAAVRQTCGDQLCCNPAHLELVDHRAEPPKSICQHLSEHTDTSGADQCWLWGGLQNKWGYGRVRNGRLAHREVYRELVGEIPAGLTIDHLCRNTLCVNPKHLEPVTQAENNRRAIVARQREIA
jgi:hypothetical protein